MLSMSSIALNAQLGIRACIADVRLGGASGSTEAINRSTIVEDRQVITTYTLMANLTVLNKKYSRKCRE